MQTSEQQTIDAFLTHSGDEHEYDTAELTCPECEHEALELDDDYGICPACMAEMVGRELNRMEARVGEEDRQMLVLAQELIDGRR